MREESFFVLDGKGLGSVVLAGVDAPVFLQGQWSQDVRKVVENHGEEGLFLDRKGRVQGDARVILRRDIGPGTYQLLSGSLDTEALRARLEAFLIADEVTLEALEPGLAAAQVSVECGRRFLEALGESSVELPGPAGWVAGRRWMILRDSSPGIGPTLLVVARDGAGLSEELLNAGRSVGLSLIDAVERERLRIRSGTPKVGVDCGPADLPNEAGLDVGRVSYTKGCFLGQEVLARIRAQGRVRRGLARISGTGPVPSLPSVLLQGERKVGELRSAVREGDGWIGLGLAATILDPGEIRLEADLHAGITVEQVPTAG